MKFLPKGYDSSFKVGEYEFLAKISYLPLYLIAKLVRVRIAVTHPKEGSDPWKRSVIVRHSESGKVIQMLISSFLEEVDYFKIA